MNSVHTKDTHVGKAGTVRVFAIAGSMRRRSYNRRLLDAARELAPGAMKLAVYEDLASIPLFSEDFESEHGFPRTVEAVRERVSMADGLLISTPEYNHSMPGVLKNLIDWLSRPGPSAILESKPVAVIGATPGAWGTRYAQSALRQVLYATESLVLPSPALYARNAASLFDGDDGKLIDPKTIGSLGKLLAAFLDWIDVHRSRS